MFGLLPCRCCLSNLFSSFWILSHQADKKAENSFDSSVFSLRLYTSVYDCEASLPWSQKDALPNILAYYSALYLNVFHGCFYCLHNLPSLQRRRKKRQNGNCNLHSAYSTCCQRRVAHLCSAVVANQPSGNFIRAVGPTVQWRSGNAETVTSGSGIF